MTWGGRVVLPNRFGHFRRLVLVARIIGFTMVGIATAFIISGVIGQFIMEGGGIPLPKLVWLLLILAMALAGCILSWRRVRLAGILLIVSGVAMGVDMAVTAGRNQLVLFMLGLPFVITGLIFVKSWRLVRPQSKSRNQ
jgi:phosphoglycerol transferase MdoB-like AlkP superfamily enzyme